MDACEEKGQILHAGGEPDGGGTWGEGGTKREPTGEGLAVSFIDKKAKFHTGHGIHKGPLFIPELCLEQLLCVWACERYCRIQRWKDSAIAFKKLTKFMGIMRQIPILDCIHYNPTDIGVEAGGITEARLSQESREWHSQETEYSASITKSGLLVYVRRD